MSAKKRAGIVAALLLPVASPAAHAGAVMLWNDTLLSIARQTPGLLTNGPPEIAREIAMVDTAIYDAVNAATGQTYKPYAYAPGPMDASADAAALQAGFTVMQSIFSNPVWGAPVSTLIPPQITQAYTAGLASLQPGTGSHSEADSPWNMARTSRLNVVLSAGGFGQADSVSANLGRSVHGVGHRAGQVEL
jgi:hypothetical protein